MLCWLNYVYNFESNYRIIKLLNILMWEYFIRFMLFNNIVMFFISGLCKCEGNKYCWKEILNVLYLVSNINVLGKK